MEMHQLTDEDINALVMEKYPKWEKERTCKLEREMREMARTCYRIKLQDERKRAQDLLEKG